MMTIADSASSVMDPSPNAGADYHTERDVLSMGEIILEEYESAPGGTRTPDPLLRRQLDYQHN